MSEFKRKLPLEGVVTFRKRDIDNPGAPSKELTAVVVTLAKNADELTRQVEDLTRRLLVEVAERRKLKARVERLEKRLDGRHS